jgi:transposase InsO family protein
MWSRYTLSAFVARKKPCNIIDALMKECVGRFGVMGCLITDNGGEFNSDEVRKIKSILNIGLCTTAADSPFQNGLCERVHAITDMMLTKHHADYGKVNLQTLLSWANMTRNSLQMWNGYSSIKSINLDQVDWELLNDNVNLVLENCKINNNVSEAKLAELQKLKEFGTYVELKDCGQNTLSTRWVITTKMNRQKPVLL